MSTETNPAEPDAVKQPEDVEARLRRHLRNTTGGLGIADLDALIAEVRRTAARETAERVWVEAAELADTEIVLWSEVPGLHPTEPEPHPAAIAAAGARRTLVVLRSRMTERFDAARIARAEADPNE